MSENPLLLPSAKSGILVERAQRPWLRFIAIAIGVGVVLIGAADIVNRLAANTLGADAALFAFGPAAALPAAEAQAEAPVQTAQGPLIPTHLSIPSLGVEAQVEQVGKKADGTMGTPKDFMDVAWYALGSKPGDDGSAVFAGHVNNARSTAGVFAHLSQIDIGDYVTVTGEDGKTLVYKVTNKAEYPADEPPAPDVFATSGPKKLILITCDGDWDSSAHTFEKRLVVTATPAYR